MNAPELSRLIRLRQLPAGLITIEAEAGERAALAARFGVTAVPRLTAEVTFEPDGAAVLATGRLCAQIEQPCAVTQEEFVYALEEPLALRFVPAGSLPEHAADEEIELDSGAFDEIEYEGDNFDLGEAIAQTLALAIDPYAEGPNADTVREKAGIVSDEEQAPAGPLAAALAALKKS